MKNMIWAALMAVGLAGQAFAGPYENLSINLGSDYATKTFSGYLKIAAHGASSTTYLLTLDGLNGWITANKFIGPLNGLADTATALAANPSDAASGFLARGIQANGTVEPAWVETAATSGSTNPVTSGAMFTALAGKIATGGLAGTATALAANGANCSAASFPLGVDASGAVEGCTTLASSNAGTATALAADGANCSAGSFPLGVDASGAVQSCTAVSASLAGTATALASDPSDAASGFLARGIQANGTVEPAWVETAATSGSTNPVTSGAMFTALAGKIATGGLAGTATALAANGANCSAGSYPLGVDASGAVESCTVASVGSEGNTYGTDGSSKTFVNAVKVSSGGVVVIGTITVQQNGAGVNAFTSAPLVVVGRTNDTIQSVIQNLSNGTAASGDLIVTGDLGGNTSFYMDVGMNSSKFSQTDQTAIVSSATYVTSSDSDLVLWSDTNGAINGAANNKLIFGSSTPVSANIAGYVGPATASGPGPWVIRSSMTNISGGGERTNYLTVVTTAAFGTTATNCSTCTVQITAAAGSGLTLKGDLRMNGTNYFQVGASTAYASIGYTVIIDTVGPSDTTAAVLKSTYNTTNLADEVVQWFSIPANALNKIGAGVLLEITSNNLTADNYKIRFTICGFTSSIINFTTTGASTYLATANFKRVSASKMAYANYGVDSTNDNPFVATSAKSGLLTCDFTVTNNLVVSFYGPVGQMNMGYSSLTYR